MKKPVGRFGFPQTPILPDLDPRPVRRDSIALPGNRSLTMNADKIQLPQKDNIIENIAENVDMIASTIVLGRGFLGRQFTIGTTPTQISNGQYLRGYLLTNPTSPVGLTNTATIFGSVARSGTGNSQAAALGVASYDSLRLFLDITNIDGAGSTVIDAQTQDPVSLNWVTAQSDIFGSPAATGTYYADLGGLGVDRSFAAAFTINSTFSTFTLGAILKGGLPGGGSGLANTIFLGPDGSVNSTNGYGLLEAKELKLFLRPNVELWAVSLISGGVTLNMFELQ